jgi:hypothetical protein
MTQINYWKLFIKLLMDGKTDHEIYRERRTAWQKQTPKTLIKQSSY